MDRQEATSFNRFSAYNAGVLAEAAEERGCQCVPYKDWFTYNRWLAQGMQVKKGEHGVKLVTIITKQIQAEDGTVKTEQFKKIATVFCRCQVKEAEHVR